MNPESAVYGQVMLYMRKLGLQADQVLAYLFLLQHGPQTVLGLSRGLKTGRTKLYPLLEKLATKQLVVIHERTYGTSYEAQSPDILEFLVSEQESKAQSLRNNLHAVTDALQSSRQQTPTNSKVIEYRGLNGLKQMCWNLGRAHGEYRTFELARIAHHISKHFDDKIYDRQVDNKILSYDLTNDAKRPSEPRRPADKKYFQARYIAPEVFNIQFETLIYNDCVALFSYEANDVFGVEVYNQKLATQEKQLFDLLWKLSTVIEN